MNRRRREPIALPLAILGGSLMLSLAIVWSASRPRTEAPAPFRPRAPESSDIDPRESPSVPRDPRHDGAPRPRSLEPADVRRALLDAGYALQVDTASGTAHVLAPMKLPCAGSVTIMAMPDEATAQAVVDATAQRDDGLATFVEGRRLMTVGIARSGGSGIDRTCTEDVVAALAR